MKAARLILTGQVVYFGPQTQVCLYLIEAEIGRIAASATKICGNAVAMYLLNKSG